MKVAVKRHRILVAQASGLQRIFYPAGFGQATAAMIIGASVAPSYQTGYAATTATTDNSLFIGFVGPNVAGTLTTAHSNAIYNRQGQSTEQNANGMLTQSAINTIYFSGGTAYTAQRIGIGFTLRSDCLEYTYTETPPTAPSDDIEMLCIFFGGTGCSAGIGTAALRAAQNTGIGISFSKFQPEIIFGAYTGPSGVITTNITNRNNSFSLGVVGRQPSVYSVYSVYGSYQGATGASTRSGIGTDVWIKSISAPNTQLTTASTAAGGAITTISGFGVSVWTRNAAIGASHLFSYMGIRFDEQYKLDYFFTPTGTGTTYIDLGFVPQFIMGSSVGATQLQVQPNTGTGASQASPDSITFWCVQGPSDYGKYQLGQGTLSTTNGSTTITGTATSFFGQLTEGYAVYDSTYNFVGVVSTLTSNTAGTFKTAATTTLSTATYFFRDYAQYNVWYGTNKGANPGQPLGGSGYTAAQYWDCRTATSSTATVSGSFITLDGTPGFRINYNTVSTVPTLNWYLAFGAEQREKRRATG